MKNFVQSGLRANVVATAAIASGDVVVIGSMVGVAEASAAAGETTVIVLEGVFELPKGDAALAQGAKAYWDATARQVTDTAITRQVTATANAYLGWVFAAAAAGDATAFIRFNPA